MNIILIGMPGAGKSTLGVLLAKLMGYMFVDSDISLQQKYGALLGQILRAKGSEGFLKLEEEMLLSFGMDRAVIATGGSAIYSKAGMAHLKANGICVYLNVPYETLKLRLGDLHKRGVVVPDGFTLKDLYDARTPLYAKFADITVQLGASGTLDDAARGIFEGILAAHPEII